jgi:adenylylsulfate kinase
MEGSVKKSFVLWFTGLPCSGKSTLADAVSEKIRALGFSLDQLDGDVVRSVFPSLGFTREDRNRHVRQMGFLASRLEHHGVVVVASFVSPYEESRNFVRELCQHYIEVHVSTPLSKCESRDVKGMYKKARRGEITQFTGVDDPYEFPEQSEIRIDTTEPSVEECANEVVDYLKQNGFLKSDAAGSGGDC